MDEPFPDGLRPCIEKFLDGDSHRPVGEDLYPEVFESDLFFPLQRPRELEAVMRLVRPLKPKTYMEIGSDKGGSLWHWLKAQPTISRCLACEVRGLPYAALFERAFPEVRFLWLPWSSNDPGTIRAVREWLGGARIDCLFLDGDKGGMVADFDAYRPVLSPRGLVLLHDITDPGPGAAFQDLCDRGYRFQAVVDTTDAARALARERAGAPPANAHESWLRHWRGKSCGCGVIELGGVA